MKIPQKYEPILTRASSWEDIEFFYINLNDEHGFGHERMLELVRHIKNTQLSKRLFAFTSHDILMITIYDSIEWNREVLHIEFNRQDNKWNFSYYSNPYQEAEFVRQYKAESGIEKLENFIKMIKW